MSFLFETAEKHASKRKSRLLDGGTTLRQVFSAPSISSAAPMPGSKAPLIPTSRGDPDGPPLSLRDAVAHLDTSGHGIDAIWLLCCIALVCPLVLKVTRTDEIQDGGLSYACPLLYLSLFVSLPGISVHFFCLFLLLYSRCRLGVAGYALSVAIYVLTVETQCMYGPSHWLAMLFGGGLVTGSAGQALLVRAIVGAESVNFGVYAWHIATALLVIVGTVGQVLPRPGHTDDVLSTALVTLACIMWAAATWLTLLPVRIACVQLYKA